MSRKVTKKEYNKALCSLAFDKNEASFIRVEAFFNLFADKNLIKYEEKSPSIKGKNLPTPVVKNFVGLAYKAILKKLGRDDPSTMRIFDTAIQKLSEHELKLEWEAIVDGTVSNIVNTMMHFEEQPDTVKQDIYNIFEGLAVPYFKNYKGKVPKEDLEWAHKQLKEYFQNLKRSQPMLKNEEKPALPGS